MCATLPLVVWLKYWTVEIAAVIISGLYEHCLLQLCLVQVFAIGASWFCRAASSLWTFYSDKHFCCRKPLGHRRSVDGSRNMHYRMFDLGVSAKWSLKYSWWFGTELLIFFICFALLFVRLNLKALILYCKSNSY